MSKLTKKQKTQVGKVDGNKLYALADALVLVKEHATAKFDESIDVAVQLGVDSKKSDQVVRGAVVLPNGTGKTVRVAVFAQGAKAEEAKMQRVLISLVWMIWQPWLKLVICHLKWLLQRQTPCALWVHWVRFSDLVD